MHVKLHFCIAWDLLQIKRLDLEVILFNLLISMNVMHIKHRIFYELEFFPQIGVSVGDCPQEFVKKIVQESQELLLDIMKIHFPDLDIHYVASLRLPVGTGWDLVLIKVETDAVNLVFIILANVKP